MTSLLFFGGWLPPFQWEMWAFVSGVVWFTLKMIVVLFIFLWTRATLPRYRYDQLMRLGWKVFLPLSLLWVVGSAGYLLYSGRVGG
jgi:NADH-quinone oxidoreductase subunit H